MSQLTTICRNKFQDKLQAEIESLLPQRVYVLTLLKKNEKKTITTVLNSVAIMIKAERKGAVSRQYFLRRNTKS